MTADPQLIGLFLDGAWPPTATAERALDRGFSRKAVRLALKSALVQATIARDEACDEAERAEMNVLAHELAGALASFEP